MKHLILAFPLIAALTACTPPPSGHSTRPDNAVIRGVNFVGISVRELDRASDFYRDTVNLQHVEDGEILNNPIFDRLAGRTGVSARTRLMRSSNAQLQFMQFAAPSPQAAKAEPIQPYGPGIAHVCFQVSKHTHAYEKFLEAGGAAIGDRDMVQLNPKNPVAYAYVRDLEHNIVEIEHVDIARLKLKQPPRNDHRIRHVSLATSDIDRAVDFYSILLQENDPRRLGRWFSISGDKVDRVSGFADSKLKFAFFQARNTELEIIQYVSHPTDTPTTPRPLDANGYNMIVFDVADLPAARERLISAGAKIVLEATAVGDGEILFARDPDGNLLGFQRVGDDTVFSSQNFDSNGI